MPRCGRLRSFIRDFNESPRAEKMSYVPPYLILIIELLLIFHALSLQEVFVIVLTGILLVISLVEIALVSREIHQRRQSNTFERILTIKLDDFIIEQREKNVKRIVEKFIEVFPEYAAHRNESYRIACQIMETHRDELWEKTLKTRMNRLLKKKGKGPVKEIIETFINRYPEYRKDPARVYDVAAKMMEKFQDET
jgi:hypothetical protein